MKATIIIPTFNHGPTLNYSIQSALAQTVKDIEIFVIGDGVPEITKKIINDFQKKDDRIQFFDHPKGPRHGEIYRHQALKQARGEIVCYLSDDDLWFPNHIETMLKLLKKHNFAHTFPLFIGTNGKPHFSPGDLVKEKWRQAVIKGKNFIPLSCAGHTLKFYHQLKEGWSTTPENTATDKNMWKKFLLDKHCKPVTGKDITLIHLASPPRIHWATFQRLNELSYWQNKIENTNLQTLLQKEAENNSLTGKNHQERNKKYQQASFLRIKLWKIVHWLRGFRYLLP
jgi:glycosyltransferase involved in cell wall biosynthesis